MQLPPFTLEDYFTQYEFSAPYMFSASDAESCSIAEILQLADPLSIKLWESLRLGYTETHGLPLLREEVSRLYSSLNKNQILICNGAGEAIYITMRVLLKPNDHVVVLTPCYQSLKEVAQATGARVTEFQLEWQNQQWTFDLAKFSQVVTDKTVMIIVNFPHNPTGFLPDKALFNNIVDIAKQHGAYLFCDEVYRLSEQESKDCLPNGADCYEKAISIGVMSKSFGLPGLRIGWVAARDAKLITELASYKNYTTLCNNAPSEILALMALRGQEKILKRNLELAKNNLQLLAQFFAQHKHIYEWYQPKAGFISFPRLKIDLDIQQFALQLIQQEGVVIAPGYHFNDQNNHFRIGYGRANLPEALLRFERFTKNYISAS